jgi:hypothetical protein
VNGCPGTATFISKKIKIKNKINISCRKLYSLLISDLTCRGCSFIENQ